MLFFITLALAVVTTVITGVLTKRWLTLGLLYWVGWLVGIPAALLAGTVDQIPMITPYGEQILLTTNYGASIAFIVSALLSIRSRRVETRPRLEYSTLVWTIVAVEFTLGLGLLASRVATSGLDLLTIRTDYLADAYLTTDLPLSYRIYNYVALTALVSTILVAARDRSLGRISWNSFTLLFMASAPGGLSTGGRIWILQVISAYFISYILAPGPALNIAQGFKRAVQTLAVLVGLGVLFTAFGTVRDTANGQGLTHPPSWMPTYVAQQIEAFGPLIGYLGVPTAAAGAYASYNTEAYGGYHMDGQQTFPFIYSQLYRFRIGDAKANLAYTTDSRKWVAESVDPRIGSTHATLAPLLVADFGQENLLFSSFAVFLVLQLAFLWAAAYGGMWHVFATILALYGGLLTFQDASFGTASAFIPLIAILVLAVPLRKNILYGNKLIIGRR
ncbi:hypothetical protein [Deinococcus altitudinis]|uniref:hypothetical protein n=1 Tax=Deinococcus altitudinis TaxID=468914 RepID=UPI0038927933